MADDKPFACPTPGCGMRFVNEDHLSVHKMKHEMSLALTPGSKLSGNLFVDFSADQTPTPTKFLRNCEEIGLFTELSKNPFEDAFKKAAQENIAHATPEVNPENGPLGGAGIEGGTLNTPTPHGLLQQHSIGRHIEMYNPLPGPSSDSGSTLDTPGIQLYKAESNENEAAIDLRMNNAASSPIKVRNDETMSDVDIDVEHTPKSEVEEDVTIVSNSVMSIAGKSCLPASTEVLTMATGEQVYVTTQDVTVSANVPSQLTSPTTPTPINVQAPLVATSPSPTLVPSAIQGHVQSIVSAATPVRPQYLMQVLVKLPNGQTMPIQFPATMAPSGGVTLATVPQPPQTVQPPPQPMQSSPQPQQLSQQMQMAMSPAATSLSTVPTPSVQTSSIICTTAPPAVTMATTEVTTTSNLPSSASAITKQKLKAAITQNVQQSVLQSNMRVMTEAVDRVTASPTILKNPQLTINASPTSSVSSIYLRSPSSSLSTSPDVQMQAADTSTPFGCKRVRKSPEEDPDERRRKFLERNRAAAARCRHKRKQWINNLERKADDINGTNLKLQSEMNKLRAEMAQLKSLLLAHKDCPIFVQQRNSGQISLETVNVQTVELGDEGSQANTSTTKVTTLNLTTCSET